MKKQKSYAFPGTATGIGDSVTLSPTPTTLTHQEQGIFIPTSISAALATMASKPSSRKHH